MVIYEITNKYTTTDELIFSQYYPTKEKALDNTTSKLECYKLELNSLGREDVANILSMDHVRMEHIQGGWNEVHDLEHIIKTEELIK